jgi:hypothetical protein
LFCICWNIGHLWQLKLSELILCMLGGFCVILVTGGDMKVGQIDFNAWTPHM